MRFFKILTILICAQVLILSGCGGGGGGGSSTPVATTKTATLVFTSYSSNSAVQIGGFDLTVTLPVGATIKKDSSGVPLSSAVYLSGSFSAATLASGGINYDVSVTPNQLTVIYASTLSYAIGEFLTVVCDVPVSYTPNISDLSYSATYSVPGSGANLPLTTTITFN